MTGNGTPLAFQATCVAIGARAVLICGPAGSGKSSLALALIDRGAQLVGDDSVMLESRGSTLFALPHPNTRGLIEVRNLGLLTMPVRDKAPIALVVSLTEQAPRWIEHAGTTEFDGVALPSIELWPDGSTLPLKVELALERFGLRLD